MEFKVVENYLIVQIFLLLINSIIGNTGKADKEAVRLYLQGIKFKNNDKNVLLVMIYKELRKLNLYNETNQNQEAI